MKVFYNGKFISCEEDKRIFSVLVEDKGKILYTGDKIPDEYRTFKKQDMNGKTITPCFGDTHMHFTSACLLSLDVRTCNTILEVINFMKEYAEKNPKDPVIGAFGISEHIMLEKRLPTKNELNRVSDLPVLLVKYDGHAGILNSAFINILPEDLKKHQDLNLDTGECKEEAFQKLCVFAAHKKLLKPSMILRNIPKLMNRLAELGINLIMPVEGLEGDDSPYDLMLALDKQTPIKVLPFLQTMDIDRAIKKKCKRVGGCFVNQLDGCFGAKDAALIEAYKDDPNNYGWMVYQQEEVDAFVKKAHQNKIQLAIHAIGDRAIKQGVNAFEKALGDIRDNPYRHCIIHGDLFPKDSIEKAGAHQLYCALQTPFLTWPEEPLVYLQSILGDRALEKHPLPLMIEAGITLANGSDHPSSRVNPIMGLYASCNHPNENYSVDIYTALKMHTLYPAKLAHQEKNMGSLSPGKVADFVVLNQDLTEMPKETLKDLKIEAVYYGGNKYQEHSFRIRPIKLMLGTLRRKFFPEPSS